MNVRDNCWTWLNMLSKSIPLFVLTPLVELLHPNEMLQWSELLTFYSILLVLDFGILINATRRFAFCNSEEEVVGTNEATKTLYGWLTAAIVLMGLIYILMFVAPEYQLAHALVLISGGTFIWNNGKVAFLNGRKSFHISQRRQLLAIGCACGIGLVGYTIIQTHLWIMAFFAWPILFGILCRGSMLKIQKKPVNADRCRSELSILVQDSWKTALGVLAGAVFVQGLALYVTKKIGSDSPAEAASLLLTVQFLRQLAAFTQVPLMVELPRLSVAWKKGSSRFKAQCHKRIALCVFLFLSGGVVFSLVKHSILSPLAILTSWHLGDSYTMLLLAFLFERMFNLYMHAISATGLVMWHKINLIYLISALALIGIFGLSVETISWILGLPAIVSLLIIGRTFMYLPKVEG